MESFDKFINSFKEKSKAAAQKAKGTAKGTAKILQLKNQLSSEKKNLKELYAAIGVLYYKKYRDDGENEFKDIFKEVGSTLSRIKELEDSIQETKETH